MHGRWPVAAGITLLLSFAAPAQEPAPGRLLIATTKSHDPEFAKSVVLLIHCDNQGAVGLMLNRPAKVSLASAFPGVPAANNRRDPVYAGGPVSLGIRALLRSNTKPVGGVLILANVYALSRKALLKETIAKKIQPNAFRVYVGYCGWSAAQLKNEVSQGLWRVSWADANLVFDPALESLWDRVRRAPVTKRAK